MAFQSLNTVEEHATESMRHLREAAKGPEAARGPWGEVPGALRRAGAGAGGRASVIAGVEVEPVFTAHPTKAVGSALEP